MSICEGDVKWRVDFRQFKPHISGGGQPPPTKFGTLLEPVSANKLVECLRNLHGKLLAEKPRSKFFLQWNPSFGEIWTKCISGKEYAEKWQNTI